MTTPKHGNWHHKHFDELFLAVQRIIPQHLASRLLGKLADCKLPWLKNMLIKLAIHQYQIDLRDAENEDPLSYPSFNAFFTRALKATARPIDSQPSSIVSAADGMISQIGQIRNGHIFQAKGRKFSTSALLGCNPEEAEAFNGGSFATVYLSPRDYHRVHSPATGRLIKTCYIPGKLFSVNDTTARYVDGLFARNERLVCWFETDHGLMVVVLVGALFVAGIETPWENCYQPGKIQTRKFDPEIQITKGAEIGRFKFGSTAIILTERTTTWHDQYVAGSKCQMGKILGNTPKLRK